MVFLPRALDPEAPIVPPPPGVQSVFVNPPNGNATVNGVASLSLSLTIIIFTLYIWGKTRNRLNLEDYLAFPAVAAFIVCHVFIYMITTTTGYFVHGWNLQVKDQTGHLFNIYITTTTYNVTMIFLKAAILLQWARLFSPGRRGVFCWLCYSIASINALFYIITILVDLLCYTPVQYHWDKSINGHSANDDLLAPLSAGINVVLDITILILPQKIIWNLNMSFRQKVKISSIFIAGILCIVAAIIRLYFSTDLLVSSNGGWGDDYAYVASYEVLLGSLEMTFAFLTFCLPAVPKPFSVLVQHTRSSLEWAAHSFRRMRSGGLSQTWSTTRVSNNNNIYQDVDTDHQGLVPIPTAGSFKSASLALVCEPPLQMQNLSEAVKDGAILRATGFHVSESFVSDSSNNTKGVLFQQHPWQSLPSQPDKH
ncbi:hypothetical protein F4811DRAFT_109014 [Daldinia bambusicola]|nr:hypothetical protein F4811DRAFT_109014 [Daldinia bambusicola]